MKKILFIVGSLRSDSFNRQLAMQAEKLLAGRAELEYMQYRDVPFFDQDVEYPVPESVERLRAAVKAADGLWIFCPEYNYSYPGVLKNLLDWLSRPVDPRDRRSGSVLAGKKAAISGAAGRSAAAGARRNLEALLKAMSMVPVGGSGTGVALDAEAFQSSRLTLSAETIAALNAQADELLASLDN